MPNIILYSSTGCSYCAKMKQQFKDWGYEWEERNTTENPAYFNDLHEKGIYSVPVVLIDDQTFIGYRPNAMKKYLGIEDEPTPAATQGGTVQEIFKDAKDINLEDTFDFVVIGAGPAGASAAVYAARGKLKVLVIDKAPTSGTLAITHKIANYPAIEEEITGYELLQKMHRQAHKFGALFIRSTVLAVDFSDDTKIIELPEGKVKAKSVFISVGAKSSTKLKGEEEFTGRGVSYCSTCDGAFFENRKVVVSGDTDEAIEETVSLSKFASQVELLVPTSKIKGELSIDELNHISNVNVHFKHRIKEVVGENKLEGVKVVTADGVEEIWPTDGVFLYLTGLKPGTDFLGDAVKKDNEGYIEVDEFLETSVKGVFAGGDARRTVVKQAVVAAADGAIAAMGADKSINKRNKIRAQYS